MKNEANLNNDKSIVNTLQTDLLFHVHEHIKDSFDSNPDYNPETDPELIEIAQHFNLNISFLGPDSILTIKLKNREVTYEQYSRKQYSRRTN